MRTGMLRQAAPIAALASLLAVLGALQYRWLGQVSAGERERLARDAERRAAAIAQDLDREVTRAYVVLQVPPEPRPGASESFAPRWDRWVSRAPHPELVSAVYLVEAAESGPRLSRFDPARRAFAPCAWPPALEPFRARVQAAGPGVPPPMPLWPDGPAVVSPVPDVLAVEDGGPVPSGPRRFVLHQGNVERVLGHRGAGQWPSWGYTVVWLDRAYLTARLLPEIAARHVQGADGPEYDVTVTTQAGDAIVWASGPPRPAGDAAAPALQVRFDDLERSLLDSVEPSAPGPDHFRVRIATGVLARPGEAPAAGWRVSLAHRAGSVDALVGALRRRNLAVSFGILGVLAASVVLVVLSAQRARRLADRQMEFVAGVSHELRTPVSVIRSAAENLADGVVADPPQVRRYGDMIVDHAARLTTMVEQVLTLAGARPRARAAQRIAPGALVEAAVADHGAELRSAGMPLEVEIEPALPEVAGDPDALRRAVSNLVANARRHARGSAVQVRARRAPDGGVAIEVEDHGPGIEPGDLPHVFEPFYRGRRATADQVPGSGLGLAVVRGVTEAHGGTVSVRSGGGDGATFTLHLPPASLPQ